MIDTALRLLASQLDAHLKSALGTPEGTVVLSRLVNDAGESALAPDTLGIALVSVEDSPHRRSVGVRAAPVPFALDLTVAVVAEDRHYEAALQRLSLAIAFFHDRPELEPAASTSLQGVSVSLLPASIETLSQLWGALRGRQMPCVLFGVQVATAAPRQA